MSANRKAELTLDEINRQEMLSRLRIAMKSAGLTQEELAERIGLSLSGVKKWLSGVSDPRWQSVVKAAEACNVKLQWLATGEGVMTETNDHHSMNEESLLSAIVAVETDLHERREVLEPKDKSKLIYLLYRTKLAEREKQTHGKLPYPPLPRTSAGERGRDQRYAPDTQQSKRRKR